MSLTAHEQPRGGSVGNIENGYFRGSGSGPLPELENSLRLALNSLPQLAQANSQQKPTQPASQDKPPAATVLAAVSTSAMPVTSRTPPAPLAQTTQASAAAPGSASPSLSAATPAAGLPSEPAFAQPIEGTIVENRIDVGSGRWLPIPAGKWKIAQTKTKILMKRKLTFQGTGARTSPAQNVEVRENVLIIQNQSESALIPGVLIRYTIEGFDDPDFCEQASNLQLPVERHGTSSTQLLSKCSGFLTTIDKARVALPGGQVDETVDLSKFSDGATAQKSGGWIVARMGIRGFNERRADINLFIKTELPDEKMEQVNEAISGGSDTAVGKALKAWAALAVGNIENGFFRGTGSGPLPALDTPLRLALNSLPQLAQANPQQRPSQPAPADKSPTATVLAAAPAATPVVASAPTSAPPTVSASTQIPSPTPAMAGATSKVEELTAELVRLREDLTRQKALQATTASLATSTSAQGESTTAVKPAAKDVIYANRKALVIGNDRYTDVRPLENAASDAQAMAKALESAGFKVFSHINVNEKQFKQALRSFRGQVDGGDEVVVSYAGHGVQLGNANYLLPVDIKGDSEEQVKDEAVMLQRLLDDLQEKKAKFSLAVIDACRDNPFPSKGRAIGGRGMAPTTAATGQMIMFSAGSGQQALDKLGADDKEKNGLFTRIFVREMTKPGISVDRVLRNVRNEVVRLARSVGHDQTPALYDQAIGEFFFKQ